MTYRRCHEFQQISVGQLGLQITEMDDTVHLGGRGGEGRGGEGREGRGGKVGREGRGGEENDYQVQLRLMTSADLHIYQVYRSHDCQMTVT